MICDISINKLNGTELIISLSNPNYKLTKVFNTNFNQFVVSRES